MVRVHGRHFNSRQPSGLNKLNLNFQLRDESSSATWWGGGGGGLMHGIKIPLQDFAPKMQGGLMRKEGRICGTLRYIVLALIMTSPFVCQKWGEVFTVYSNKLCTCH